MRGLFLILAVVAIPTFVSAYDVDVTETQLTFGPADQFDARMSGTNIVFTDRSSGDDDIALYVSPGVATIIGGGPGIQHQADIGGDFVVWVDESTGYSNIFCYNLQTAQGVPIEISQANDTEPDTDGTFILFVSDRMGVPQIYHSFTSDPTSVTQSFPSPNEQGGPSIDGGLAAYHEWSGASYDLMLGGIGGSPFAFASSAADEMNASLDPPYCAFSIGDDVAVQRYMQFTPTMITNDGYLQNNVRLTGDYILFNDDRYGYTHIFLYDRTYERIAQLTCGDSDQILTDAFGNKAVFHDNRDGNHNVYQIEFTPDPDANTPPIASPAADPASGECPLEVQFTANATDDDCDTLYYDWNFGDGGSSTEENPLHEYNTNGVFSVAFSVTDGEDEFTATLTVTVEEAPNHPPTASPTAIPSSGSAPLLVSFAANAEDPDDDPLDYDWDFGDEGTSTEENPSHEYTSDGTFDVSLTVSDGEYEFTTNLTVTVDENTPPTASPTATPSSGRVPLTVSFEANGFDADGDALTFNWDFGDDETSTDEDPHHEYLTSGEFTVTLIVSDAVDSFTTTLTVTVDENTPPTAAPTATPSSGRVPLTVRFEANGFDADGDALIFNWDFGDGATSADEDPIHEYLSSGEFTVTLIVSDAVDSFTTTLTVTVDENTPPTAAPTATPSSGRVPLTVSFEANGFDADGDALTFNWDFGDGATSADEDPIHEYLSSGEFTVTLIVSDAVDSFTTTLTVTVDENTPPTAAPTATPSSGRVPLTVSFEANGFDADGDALTFNWDFGDGATSADEDPIHEYLSSGEFTVTLIVSDAVDSFTTTLTVTVDENTPPTAAPTATPSSGRVPLTVRFEANGFDADGDALIFNWDFGDGATSADEDPIHEYLSSGEFTVTLIVSDAVDSFTTTLTVTVDENTPPTAAPTATPSSGRVPLTVSFEANGFDADGDALTFNWDFGDGATSADEDPIHEYLSSGEFTVTLIVSDAVDSFTTTLTVTVDENTPPTAAPTATPSSGRVPLTVSFEANGFDADGDALTFNWDFGDGATSADEDPIHEYLSSGEFTVTLIVSDAVDSFTTTLTVTVDENTPPTAAPTATPSSGRVPLTVRFEANGFDADGDALIFNWDFGDGATSADEDPIHEYLSSGEFTVTLIVSDAVDSFTTTLTVTVEEPPNTPPTADPTATPSTGIAPLTVNFHANASDEDGDDLSYHWDFGDGETDTEENPQHTYVVPGEHIVTLTVSDQEDDFITTLTITVEEVANTPPTANPTATPASGYAPILVHFFANAWDDNGDTLTFAWDFGDGETSDEENPSHEYMNAGVYTITLTVDDSVDSFTTTLTVHAWTDQGPCDLDMDGDVDDADLILLVGSINGPGVPPGDPAADLDNDNDVDLHDFALFMQAYPISGAITEE